MTSTGRGTAADLIAAATRAIETSTATAIWRRAAARDDAEELLELALRRRARRGDLEAPPPAPVRRRFDALVGRRVAGEPMAMIRGHVDFGGLDLVVRRATFAPRVSSEFLATEAIRRLRGRQAPVAVDLATGTGPVALLVAARVAAAEVWGVDLDPAPIAVAGLNRRRLGLLNAHFRAGDLFDPLPARLRGRVDAITMHPPYVPSGEIGSLPDELLYEPVVSLTDRSVDGLGLVRRLAAEGPDWLRPGGWALVEVSPDLSRGVAASLRRGGFTQVRSRRGPTGVTSVVAGRLPGRAARR